jgi:hypothetical protein
MDVYQGQFDFANHTTQIHDFNPGFGDPVNAQGDSTFWIAPIPNSDVQVSNLLGGRAEMHVRNLPVEDYFDLDNALADGPAAEATVSFDMVWNGPVTRTVNVRDAAHGFTGTFVENQVTVTWSGTNELGFAFDSNVGNFSTSVPGRTFAEIGREHNGVFFPGGTSPFLASPSAGLQVNPPGDPAFALLAAQGQTVVVAPVAFVWAQSLTGQAPLHLAGVGSAESVFTSQPDHGLAADSLTKMTTVARTAPEHAVGFVEDPTATSATLFTAIGQQGEDLLFR